MTKKIVLYLFLCLQIFANEQELYEQIQTLETQESIEKWENSIFSLKPHYPNYILPYGFRNANYTSYDTDSREYTNIEAQLQISFKINLANDFFGLNEAYYLSYSHLAFWQIYVESAPFRETNYNPEAFVIFPISDADSIFHLKDFTVGYSHLSNGQGNDGNITSNSRSVNYFYTILSMKHGALITDLIAWIPLMGNDLSDNPDIMDYVGFGQIKLTYFRGKHMYTLRGRGSLDTGKGLVEGTYSYPIVEDIYFYAKVFSGYGESLIDYNHDISKFSVGFSFSR